MSQKKLEPKKVQIFATFTQKVQISPSFPPKNANFVKFFQKKCKSSNQKNEFFLAEYLCLAGGKFVPIVPVGQSPQRVITLWIAYGHCK